LEKLNHLILWRIALPRAWFSIARLGDSAWTNLVIAMRGLSTKAVYSRKMKVSSFSLLRKGRERLVEQREETPARPGYWLPWRARMPRDATLKGARKPRRFVWFALSACHLLLGAVMLAVVVGGLFVARLAMGPISIDSLGPEIAKALNQRFGRGYDFSLGGTSVVNRGYAPTLSFDGLSLKETSGKTILTAPRAEVSVDLLALIAGRVTPKRLEVFDVELRLALLPDGSIALPVAPGSAETVPLTPPLADSLAQSSPAPPAEAEASSKTLAAPPPAAAPQDLAAPQESPPRDLVPPLLSARPPRALLAQQMAAAIRLLVDTLTSPESPIAAVDRVGIARGRLVIDDRTTNQQMIFNGLNVAFDKTSGATTFALSVDGPNGRWTAKGLASGTPGAERKLMLSLNNLSLDEILLATGARNIGADFDMPLSAKLSLALHADGMLSEAAGQVDFGAGFLRFDDPNDEPMMVDAIHGGFHWDPATRRIMIDRWRLTAGGTHAELSGSVALPEREGDPWTIGLASAEPTVVAPERPGQTAVVVDAGEGRARLFLAEKKLVLDRIAFSGPRCGFAMAGEVDWTNGPHIRLGASLSPTPITVVTRLWPSFIVAPVRSYLLAHAKEGMVEKAELRVDFDAPTLALMRAEHAPADEAVLLDFTISGGSLDFLTGVPPLRGVDGVGRISGRTTTFTVTNTGVVDAGAGGTLAVLEGSSFRVADSELQPTPGVIMAKVSSSVETIADLLSRDALKAFASLPLESSTLKGQVDGGLEIDMLLGPDIGPDDISLKINATVANFTAENLIGKERLEAATLAITVDPSGLRASGQGRMFGSLATLDMVRPNGKPAEASIRLTLDEAARARQGFGALPGLSGPVGAIVSAPLGTGDKPRAEVELDLTQAGLEWPGVSKPPGRPAKVKLSLVVNENGALLDPFVFEAGPVQARGSLELGGDESLVAARFSQVKLSAGDDMRIDAVRVGEAMKVLVRASTIDARPFLQSLIYAKAEPGPAAKDAAASKDAGAIKEIELDVKAGVLSGYNKEVISGAELHLVKRADQIKQFSFSGRFGRDSITGNLTGGPATPQLNLITDDAGTLLSFVDLYKHMDRGRLSVGMRLGPDLLAGVLVIDSFVLRDEPALRRLVAESVPQADGVRRIDAGAVAFTKLQVRFQRSGSRLDLTEGTMYGDSIGLTVDGWLDYSHDRVDMKGTFVPAYAVNNLFSKIPVFGMILGGGANEGLFGVNYRIEGQASSPTLNINPLSAIAPGIFRQIFGVGNNFAPSGGGARP
jgi:hypothetical protein